MVKIGENLYFEYVDDAIGHRYKLLYPHTDPFSYERFVDKGEFAEPGVFRKRVHFEIHYDIETYVPKYVKYEINTREQIFTEDEFIEKLKNRNRKIQYHIFTQRIR